MNGPNTKDCHGASGIVVIRNHDNTSRTNHETIDVLRNVTWEQGAITYDNGKTWSQSKTNSSVTIRTNAILPVSKNKTCHLDFNSTDYRVCIYAFGNDKNQVSGLNYTGIWFDSAEEFVPGQPFIAIAIKRTDGESIVPASATGITLTQDNTF